MPGTQRLSPIFRVEQLLRYFDTPPSGPSSAALPYQGITHRRLKPRQALFRAGQPFSTLYIVRVGYLKTIRYTEQNVERVMHFPMRYDWLGLDGIGSGTHACDAVALTHSELIALPFEALMVLTRQSSAFQRVVYEAISLNQCTHERDSDLMAVSGAEQRVAQFLLVLANRHAQRGLPESAFALPMTRKDIGAFLGLTLETVSRALSALALSGAIRVNRRTIHIIKRQGLIDWRRYSTRKVLTPAPFDFLGSVSSSTPFL